MPCHFEPCCVVSSPQRHVAEVSAISAAHISDLRSTDGAVCGLEWWRAIGGLTTQRRLAPLYVPKQAPVHGRHCSTLFSCGCKRCWLQTQSNAKQPSPSALRPSHYSVESAKAGDGARETGRGVECSAQRIGRVGAMLSTERRAERRVKYRVLCRVPWSEVEVQPPDDQMHV